MDETKRLVAEAIQRGDVDEAMRLLGDAQLPENTVMRCYFEGGNIRNLPIPVRLGNYHDIRTTRIYVNFVVELMQLQPPLRVERVEIGPIQDQ